MADQGENGTRRKNATAIFAFARDRLVPGDVVLTRARSAWSQSRIIQVATAGLYSHAAIPLDDRLYSDIHRFDLVNFWRPTFARMDLVGETKRALSLAPESDALALAVCAHLVTVAGIHERSLEERIAFAEKLEKVADLRPQVRSLALVAIHHRALVEAHRELARRSREAILIACATVGEVESASG